MNKPFLAPSVSETSLSRRSTKMGVKGAERMHRGGVIGGVSGGLSRTGTRAVYAACALALLYAAVSFYWAAGGTAGLDTLGGELEELGRARDPGLIALVWVTGVLKVVAGLIPLALVRPWGRVLPRWMLLTAVWSGAVLLTGYGGFLVTVEALVVSGIINPTGPVDWTALWWHVALWDAWFVVRGVLLGVAVWHHMR